MEARKQETSPQSRLQWLDEELRDTKSALHKVQHELEQALSQIWNLDSGLRKLQESLGDARGFADVVPGIQEEIRQLQAETGRLLDRQNETSARADEQGRQQQVELEHERQERSAVLKKAESAARSVGGFDARVRRLEEFSHRVEEGIAQMRLAQETLAHDLEEMRSRGDRNLEAVNRLEHQLSSAGEDIEALRKRDADIEEKLGLFGERVHRAEDRVDEVQGHLDLSLEIKEQLDRSRFERQQISERLASLETSTTQLLDRTAEFVQGIARIDQRSQGQAGRLLEITEDLRQQREMVAQQMNRLVHTMERQRKRQAETLAQEIKELGRSEFNPDE